MAGGRAPNKTSLTERGLRSKQSLLQQQNEQSRQVSRLEDHPHEMEWSKSGGNWRSCEEIGTLQDYCKCPLRAHAPTLSLQARSMASLTRDAIPALLTTQDDMEDFCCCHLSISHNPADQCYQCLRPAMKERVMSITISAFFSWLCLWKCK